MSARTNRSNPAPAPPSSDDGIEPRVGVYEEALRESLGPNLRPFAAYYADARRVRTLANLLARHFHGRTGPVLNVACGAFSIEYLVLALRHHDIVSFDYTRGFAPAYRALRERGELANTLFFIGDARLVEFQPDSFDLVIMNDLLYEPLLSLDTLVPKYDRYLRPGGLLFLTVVDVRTRWIWKALGRGQPFRRYAIPAVLALLHEHGYRVLDCVPSALDSQRRLGRLFRRALWNGFRLSNEWAIVAAKGDGG